MNEWMILSLVLIFILFLVVLFYYIKEKKRRKEENKEIDDLTKMILNVRDRLHDVKYKRPKNIKVNLEEKDRI